MTYDLTCMQNASGLGWLICANTYTGGILFGFFIVIIYFVMLFALKRYDFDDALLASSWTCFILSAILAYAKDSSGVHLLNIIFPLGFLVVAGFSALYIWATKHY